MKMSQKGKKNSNNKHHVATRTHINIVYNII